VRIKYDGETDAAYIYLKDSIQQGEAAQTIVCAVDIESASIHLDFDETGHLLGIEVLGASRVLPDEVISDARSG
jgi:uncharacterized protein YuzE